MAAKKIQIFGDSKGVGVGEPPLGSPTATNCDGIRLALYQAMWNEGVQVTFVGSFNNVSNSIVAAALGGSHNAISGSVISDMTSTAAARVTTFAPDAVIVDTGTNDVDGGSTSTANVTTNYNALLDAIRSGSATVPILMTKCIPLLSSNGLTFMSSFYSQLDSIYSTRHATDSNLYLVDCSGFPSSEMSTRFDGFPDLYHAGRAGYIDLGSHYFAPVLRRVPNFRNRGSFQSFVGGP